MIAGVLALIMLVVANIARELFPPKTIAPQVIPITLVCTDPQNEMIPVLTSPRVEHSPDSNFYYYMDTHGIYQTFVPSYFQTCGTVTEQDAKDLGIIQ